MRTSIASLVGFVAGVVLTLFVVSYRAERAAVPQSATGSLNDVARDPVGFSLEGEVGPLRQSAADERVQPEQSSQAAAEMSTSVARQEVVPTTKAVESDQRQTPPVPRSAARNGETPGRIPLIDGLKLEGRVADAHEQLGSEDRNPSWAPYMEAQLLTYLGAQTALLQEFSVPTVACRQSMCEIQVIGYGANAFETWMNQTSAMLGEPWAAEFGGNMMVNTMPVAPGVQGMVFILKRESGTRSIIDSASAAVHASKARSGNG